MVIGVLAQTLNLNKQAVTIALLLFSIVTLLLITLFFHTIVCKIAKFQLDFFQRAIETVIVSLFIFTSIIYIFEICVCSHITHLIEVMLRYLLFLFQQTYFIDVSKSIREHFPMFYGKKLLDYINNNWDCINIYIDNSCIYMIFNINSITMKKS